MVDNVLVPQKAHDGLVSVVRRIPQEHCVVVACADKPLGDRARLATETLLISVACRCSPVGFVIGHVLGVTKEPCAKHKVRGKRQLVDPRGMGLEMMNKGTGSRIPHYDGSIIRGRVDEAGTPPLHTRNGVLVASEDVFGAPRVDHPNTDAVVLACAR